MKTRLITSAYILIGLIVAFLFRMLTPYVFDLMIGGLTVIGACEVARVLEKSRNFNNVYIVALFPAILYVGFIAFIELKWPWEYYLLYLLCLVLVLFLVCFCLTFILKKQTQREINKYNISYSVTKYAFKKAMNTIFIFLYPTLLFFSLFVINHIFDFELGAKIINSPFDYYLLVSIFVITMSTDSLAYLVGSLIKGPKLCPVISPKKTISGAVGGFIGGIASAFLVYWLFSYNQSFISVFNNVASLWSVALLGLIGAFISQFGDIFASYLKRKAYVKDYGTIFPGHGGVMDRVDGLIWNATFVLIFVLILL